MWIGAQIQLESTWFAQIQFESTWISAHLAQVYLNAHKKILLENPPIPFKVQGISQYNEYGVLSILKNLNLEFRRDVLLINLQLF